jgi:hypothetical protein
MELVGSYLRFYLPANIQISYLNKTSVPPVENPTGSLVIYFESFRTSPAFSCNPYQSHML